MTDSIFLIIHKAAKRVYDELGGFYKEVHYQRALEKELECVPHLTVERERTISIFYTTSKNHSVHVGDGKADLVVHSTIAGQPTVIIETKIRKTSSDKPQLKRYINGFPDLITAGVIIYFTDTLQFDWDE